MEKILIVDDEKSMRDFLSIVLKKEGYFVAAAGDGQEAIQILQRDIFDLVLTDIKMPKLNGIELLKMVKDVSAETVVLMITAFASTETAIEAMKQGAYDYITKPFQIDEVKLIIRNALEGRRLRTENLLLKRQLSGKADFEGIVGKSAAMQKVFDIVRKVADTRTNILILGESGTGKEMIAHAIHFNSRRTEKPFVTVNCSALPETLLESELFGHMKGSFTGAHANKAGLFEVANEGSIFLDEIGETPQSIQVKLLRVLEEKEFRRIGGTKSVKVDVRIIAATNRDLEKAVAEGAFREDLYYRLDVIPIHLPPLRDRVEDISVLANHFLARAAKAAGKQISRFTPETIRMLEEQEWRGNVRELENFVERVVALATEDRVTEEDAASCLNRPAQSREIAPMDLPAEGVDLEGVMDRLEKALLFKALERSRGVRREAARLLGLNMRSFRYRLSKHKIRKARPSLIEEGEDTSESDAPE